MRVHLSALLPEVRSIAFAVAAGIACIVTPSGLRDMLRRRKEAKER